MNVCFIECRESLEMAGLTSLTVGFASSSLFHALPACSGVSPSSSACCCPCQVPKQWRSGAIVVAERRKAGVGSPGTLKDYNHALLQCAR